MSTYYDNPTLYVKHIPDAGPDATHPNPSSVELGAGMLEVGVNVGGLEIPLIDLKASDYPQRIEQAKQDAQKQSDTQAQSDAQAQADAQTSTAGQPGTGYETPAS